MTKPDSAVLYVGLNNYVAVSVPGYKAAQFDFSFPGAHVVYEKTDPDTLFLNVTVSQPGMVHMQVLDRKSKKKMGNIDFTAAFLPDPQLQLTWVKNTATKEQLLALPGLYLSFSRSLLQYRGAAVSYEFTVLNRDSLYTLMVKGPDLPDEAVRWIRSLSPGSKVFFDDIKMPGPDGRVRTLNPISVLVKE